MNRLSAKIGQRFTAQFIDGLIAFTLGAMTYLLLKQLGLPLEYAFASWFAYLMLCDGLPGGQSIGKRFCKISVVHFQSEEPCSYLQSFGRNITMFLGVFDAMFIAGKSKRRLGDYLGRTKVLQM
ncbi:RDD family protein [Variovorax sp. PCZ-1]|uniref:RDD family protein n=1 Tax=Variovorax sp. PCZ-1 TaxID=2835533 RepID=UPI001BCB8320|nr:RDD family protein [Variovorax sp. PCZ-1]MBS7807875.1 RDD family protein [Variovorax sp. PCZ-1]